MAHCLTGRSAGRYAQSSEPRPRGTSLAGEEVQVAVRRQSDPLVIEFESQPFHAMGAAGTLSPIFG